MVILKRKTDPGTSFQTPTICAGSKLRNKEALPGKFKAFCDRSTIVFCCSWKVPGMISPKTSLVDLFLDSPLISTNKLHLLHASITSRRKTPLTSTVTVTADSLSRRVALLTFAFFFQDTFAIKFSSSLY